MIDKLIKKNIDVLNNEDIKTLLYIKVNTKDILNSSLKKISDDINSSEEKVLKTLNKIGVNSYDELYKVLTVNQKFNEFDIEKMYFNYNDTINDLRNRDDSKLFQAILNSKRVFLYGTGTIQDNICKEIVRAFIFLNINALHIRGRSQRKIVEEEVGEDDLVIIVSLSGENKNAIEFLENIKDKTNTFSITKKGYNTISKMTDYNIQFFVEDIFIDKFGVGIAPLNQQYLLVDYLFISLYIFKNKYDF